MIGIDNPSGGGRSSPLDWLTVLASFLTVLWIVLAH